MAWRSNGGGSSSLEEEEEVGGGGGGIFIGGGWVNPIRTRGRIRRDPTAGIVPRAFRCPGGVGPGRQPSASRFFFSSSLS